MPTPPNPDQEWIRRCRAETGLDPNELLTAEDVAALIGVKRQTIYQYRRYGNIPVPDVQEGGKPYKKGEVITWTGRSGVRTRVSGIVFDYNVANQRTPRSGELKNPRRVAWKRWRIHQWIANRPGSGWHASGKDRKTYAQRRKVGAGAWIPPKGPIHHSVTKPAVQHAEPPTR